VPNSSGTAASEKKRVEYDVLAVYGAVYIGNCLRFNGHFGS